MHAHEAAQAFAERMHSTLPVLIVCVFIQMIFAAFDDDCLDKAQLKCKTTSECYYEFQVSVFFHQNKDYFHELEMVDVVFT